MPNSDSERLPLAPQQTVSPAAGPVPGTRAELEVWIREQLRLESEPEAALCRAIDEVMTRQERLWKQSKDEAIKALLQGFAERMTALRHAIVERDETVSNISQYFERLVSDLTDKTHRDPKTKLMNFGRFMEQLESFLALEQRAGGAPSDSSISPDSSGTTTRSVTRWATASSNASPDSRRADSVRRPDRPGEWTRALPRICTPGSEATSSVS